MSSDPTDRHRAALASTDAAEASLVPNRKVVMVIYGHDREAKIALFDWLRSIGLQPREWNQLIYSSGSASPYIGDVLNQAFKDAQAVIAFFTPDEHVIDRTVSGKNDAWRLQARPNVLIEAGMALITHPQRTVLVVHGPQELPSDLAGRHYIRLNHTSVEPLHDLATRLREAGCDTDITGSDWLNPARFPDRENLTPQPVISESPPTTADNKTSARKRKQPDGQNPVLPLIDPTPYIDREKRLRDYREIDLAIKGRLLITAQPGRPSQISRDAREAILATLSSDKANLTGVASALIYVMDELTGRTSFGVSPWQLDGPNDTQQISACWQGIAAERLVAEARLHASLLTQRSGDHLTTTIDVLLADPLHPTLSDMMANYRGVFEASEGFGKSTGEEVGGPLGRPYVPKPFLDLEILGYLLFNIIGSLWGPVGETLSTSVFSQPLEPPSVLDLTVFSIPYTAETGLHKRIDFSGARLISGNTPGAWTNLGPIYPDREFHTPGAQAIAVRDLLIKLVMDNGFQDAPQEVTEWPGRTTEAM